MANAIGPKFFRFLVVRDSLTEVRRNGAPENQSDYTLVDLGSSQASGLSCASLGLCIEVDARVLDPLALRAERRIHYYYRQTRLVAAKRGKPTRGPFREEVRS